MTVMVDATPVPAYVAMISIVPTPSAVTNPVLAPVLSTVATAGLSVAHSTVATTGFPFESRIEAVNVCVSPTIRVATVGVTLTVTLPKVTSIG